MLSRGGPVPQPPARVLTFQCPSRVSGLGVEVESVEDDLGLGREWVASGDRLAGQVDPGGR